MQKAIMDIQYLSPYSIIIQNIIFDDLCKKKNNQVLKALNNKSIS